ncbi:hypothetical protein QOZ80_6AG0509460 [Eleusine coracana subsp. coracana]|nr:hypothetical protein QOZ80_6AG0509460 [Eleusine coracana subsp. coracana]
MVPLGAEFHGGGGITPAASSSAAARDDDVGYETHVLIPLFLASAFLFFVAYQLFGAGAAAGVVALFLVLAVAAHRVRVSRTFPFLHLSLARHGGGDDGAYFQSTAGTGAAALPALPAAFEYKRDHAAATTTGWAQCAICLGLVRVGEAVRRLPACGHLFHAGCIEKWVQAHATCPLCRAAVSAAVPELPA